MYFLTKVKPIFRNFFRHFVAENFDIKFLVSGSDQTSKTFFETFVTYFFRQFEYQLHNQPTMYFSNTYLHIFICRSFCFLYVNLILGFEISVPNNPLFPRILENILVLRPIFFRILSHCTLTIICTNFCRSHTKLKYVFLTQLNLLFIRRVSAVFVIIRAIMQT